MVRTFRYYLQEMPLDSLGGLCAALLEQFHLQQQELPIPLINVLLLLFLKALLTRSTGKDGGKCYVAIKVRSREFRNTTLRKLF